MGSGLRIEGREGRETQTVAAIAADAVRYEFDLGTMGRPVQTIRVASRESRVEFTWTMEADIGFNSVARVMGLFMDRMVGPILERCPANLEIAV